MTSSTVPSLILSGVMLIALCTPAHAEVQALIDFRNCLETGTATECSLAPGVYDVERTIEVRNPSLQTIQGLGATAQDTTLRRIAGNSQMAHIMSIHVNNVHIVNLQFDGNKAAYVGTPDGWADLRLYGSGIDVDYVYFKNAVHFALIIGYSPIVRYCTFYDSRDAGIYGSNDMGSMPGFNIHGNTFQDNGGGAMAVYSQSSYSAPSWFYENSLYRNHRNPVATNARGGQIMLGEQSTYIYVMGNYFDGGGLYGSGVHFIDGIEAYGSYHTFSGNYIRSHTGAGMHTKGLQNSSIDGGTNSWEIRENSFDGVQLINFPGYPNTQNVGLYGVRINNNGQNGVRIDPGGQGSISNITIANPVSISVFWPYAQVCANNPVSYVYSDVPVTMPCR
jgi:hypothetical protein